ncbi:MAG: hypothetical protein WCX16_02370, partial [Candidatus Omnitrophota bacterium]
KIPSADSDILVNSMVAYHGSPSNFENFDEKFIGSGEGPAMAGKGFYFSTGKRLAPFYANIQSSDAPMHLGTGKPKPGQIIDPTIYTLNLENTKLREVPNRSTAKKLQAELQKQGYDGVKIGSEIVIYSTAANKIKILKKDTIDGFVKKNPSVEFRSWTQTQQKKYERDLASRTHKTVISTAPTMPQAPATQVAKAPKASSSSVAMKTPKAMKVSAMKTSRKSNVGSSTVISSSVVGIQEMMDYGMEPKEIAKVATSSVIITPKDNFDQYVQELAQTNKAVYEYSKVDVADLTGEYVVVANVNEFKPSDEKARIVTKMVQYFGDVYVLAINVEPTTSTTGQEQGVTTTTFTPLENTVEGQNSLTGQAQAPAFKAPEVPVQEVPTFEPMTPTMPIAPIIFTMPLSMKSGDGRSSYSLALADPSQKANPQEESSSKSHYPNKVDRQDQGLPSPVQNSIPEPLSEDLPPTPSSGNGKVKPAPHAMIAYVNQNDQSHAANIAHYYKVTVPKGYELAFSQINDTVTSTNYHSSGLSPGIQGLSANSALAQTVQNDIKRGTKIVTDTVMSVSALSDIAVKAEKGAKVVQKINSFSVKSVELVVREVRALKNTFSGAQAASQKEETGSNSSLRFVVVVAGRILAEMARVEAIIRKAGVYARGFTAISKASDLWRVLSLQEVLTASEALAFTGESVSAENRVSGVSGIVSKVLAVLEGMFVGTAYAQTMSMDVNESVVEPRMAFSVIENRTGVEESAKIVSVKGSLSAEFSVSGVSGGASDRQTVLRSMSAGTAAAKTISVASESVVEPRMAASVIYIEKNTRSMNSAKTLSVRESKIAEFGVSGDLESMSSANAGARAASVLKNAEESSRKALENLRSLSKRINALLAKVAASSKEVFGTRGLTKQYENVIGSLLPIFVITQILTTLFNSLGLARKPSFRAIRQISSAIESVKEVARKAFDYLIQEKAIIKEAVLFVFLFGFVVLLLNLPAILQKASHYEASAPKVYSLNVQQIASDTNHPTMKFIYAVDKVIGITKEMRGQDASDLDKEFVQKTLKTLEVINNNRSLIKKNAKTYGLDAHLVAAILFGEVYDTKEFALGLISENFTDKYAPIFGVNTSVGLGQVNVNTFRAIFPDTAWTIGSQVKATKDLSDFQVAKILLDTNINVMASSKYIHQITKELKHKEQIYIAQAYTSSFRDTLALLPVGDPSSSHFADATFWAYFIMAAEQMIKDLKILEDQAQLPKEPKEAPSKVSGAWKAVLALASILLVIFAAYKVRSVRNRKALEINKKTGYKAGDVVEFDIKKEEKASNKKTSSAIGNKASSATTVSTVIKRTFAVTVFAALLSAIAIYGSIHVAGLMLSAALIGYGFYLLSKTNLSVACAFFWFEELIPRITRRTIIPVVMSVLILFSEPALLAMTPKSEYTAAKETLKNYENVLKDAFSDQRITRQEKDEVFARSQDALKALDDFEKELVEGKQPTENTKNIKKWVTESQQATKFQYHNDKLEAEIYSEGYEKNFKMHQENMAKDAAYVQWYNRGQQKLDLLDRFSQLSPETVEIMLGDRPADERYADWYNHLTSEEEARAGFENLFKNGNIFGFNGQLPQVILQGFLDSRIYPVASVSHNALAENTADKVAEQEKQEKAKPLSQKAMLAKADSLQQQNSRRWEYYNVPVAQKSDSVAPKNLHKADSIRANNYAQNRAALEYQNNQLRIAPKSQSAESWDLVVGLGSTFRSTTLPGQETTTNWLPTFDINFKYSNSRFNAFLTRSNSNNGSFTNWMGNYTFGKTTMKKPLMFSLSGNLTENRAKFFGATDNISLYNALGIRWGLFGIKYSLRAQNVKGTNADGSEKDIFKVTYQGIALNAPGVNLSHSEGSLTTRLTMIQFTPTQYIKKFPGVVQYNLIRTEDNNGNGKLSHQGRASWNMLRTQKLQSTVSVDMFRNDIEKLQLKDIPFSARLAINWAPQPSLRFNNMLSYQTKSTSAYSTYYATSKDYVSDQANVSLEKWGYAFAAGVNTTFNTNPYANDSWRFTVRGKHLGPVGGQLSVTGNFGSGNWNASYRSNLGRDAYLNFSYSLYAKSNFYTLTGVNEANYKPLSMYNLSGQFSIGNVVVNPTASYNQGGYAVQESYMVGVNAYDKKLGLGGSVRAVVGPHVTPSYSARLYYTPKKGGVVESVSVTGVQNVSLGQEDQYVAVGVKFNVGRIIKGKNKKSNTVNPVAYNMPMPIPNVPNYAVNNDNQLVYAENLSSMFSEVVPSVNNLGGSLKSAAADNQSTNIPSTEPLTKQDVLSKAAQEKENILTMMDQELEEAFTYPRVKEYLQNVALQRGYNISQDLLVRAPPEARTLMYGALQSQLSRFNSLNNLDSVLDVVSDLLLELTNNPAFYTAFVYVYSMQGLDPVNPTPEQLFILYAITNPVPGPFNLPEFVVDVQAVYELLMYMANNPSFTAMFNYCYQIVNPPLNPTPTNSNLTYQSGALQVLFGVVHPTSGGTYTLAAFVQYLPSAYDLLNFINTTGSVWLDAFNYCYNLTPGLLYGNPVNFNTIVNTATNLNLGELLFNIVAGPQYNFTIFTGISPINGQYNLVNAQQLLTYINTTATPAWINAFNYCYGNLNPGITFGTPVYFTDIVNTATNLSMGEIVFSIVAGANYNFTIFTDNLINAYDLLVYINTTATPAWINAFNYCYGNLNPGITFGTPVYFTDIVNTATNLSMGEIVFSIVAGANYN